MSTPGSYTVVLIPLRNSLNSLDAVRFFSWLKRLKDLEREKDCLWAGLQVLEQAQLWYRQRLEENRGRQAFIGTGPWHKENSSKACLLRSHIQRVNGSLGDLMCDPSVAGFPFPEPSGDPDSKLRWQNRVLIQEVSARSNQISMLEQERDSLLQQLGKLQAC